MHIFDAHFLDRGNIIRIFRLLWTLTFNGDLFDPSLVKTLVIITDEDWTHFEIIVIVNCLKEMEYGGITVKGGKNKKPWSQDQ